VVPARLGGELGTVLDRRGSAGIDQRQRLGAFGWSSENEACADYGGKPQNLRYVHDVLLQSPDFSRQRGAADYRSTASSRRRSKIGESDVNLD
jgi:hypothetical protein